jgi:hypothetical protein
MEFGGLRDEAFVDPRAAETAAFAASHRRL